MKRFKFAIGDTAYDINGDKYKVMSIWDSWIEERYRLDNGTVKYKSELFTLNEYNEYKTSKLNKELMKSVRFLEKYDIQ